MASHLLKNTVNLLVSYLKEAKQLKKDNLVLTVGIVGVPTCGKTYLTQHLIKRLDFPSVWLEETHWILPRLERDRKNLSGIAAASYDLTSMKNALLKAKRGQEITFYKYIHSGSSKSLGTHSVKENVLSTVNAKIIILDGCPWFYDIFAKEIDLYIFIMPSSLNLWKANLEYRDITQRGRTEKESFINFKRNLNTLEKEIAPIINRASLCLIQDGLMEKGNYVYTPKSIEHIIKIINDSNKFQRSLKFIGDFLI